MSSEGRGFGFLQLDSPFMRFLSVLADLMILNFLTLLCCIPIVTAGASFSAMHYVLTKMVRNEEGYIGKMFFHAFKQNVKQATVLWIGVVVVGALLFMDWYVLMQMIAQSPQDSFTSVMLVLVYAAALVVYLMALYLFPIQSRYTNTIRGTLKMAFSMAVYGMVTLRTVANGLLFLVPFGVLWYGGWNAIPFLLVFCFSAPGYVRALLYNGLFKKYETSPEELEQQVEEAKKKREEQKKNKKRFH